MTLRRIFCIVLPCFIFFAFSSGKANLRSVPQQYKTIQAAVNASKIGDTVLVDKGVYYENIFINKNIVLASRFIIDGDTAYISHTIIDGSHAVDKHKASTIFISGGTDTTCIVCGMTIRSGTGSYIRIPGERKFEDWILGGGIIILNSGAHILNNIVTKNILMPVGTIVNTAGAGISTIYIPNRSRDAVPVIIEKNTVTENSAIGQSAETAGIAVQQPGVVRHNIISNNTTISRSRAPGGGLSLYLDGRHNILADGNDIRHNRAGIGAGILVGTAAPFGGHAIILNNIIAENQASEVGGGVHIAENVWAILINNTVVGNDASANGDGLSSALGASVTIINNIFWNNNPYQIMEWSAIRAINNLIEGGFKGINILNADPKFLPGDSLFRLSSESPAIGTGIAGTTLALLHYASPDVDFANVVRPLPRLSNPDLGATESRYSTNKATIEILHRWKEESKNRLKLTITFRQKTSPQYDADSLHVVRAGLMAVQVIENDSIVHCIDENSSTLSFTLPPGSNMLDVELIARGRSEFNQLPGVFRLEGLDPSYNTLTRNRSYLHRQYANISPGSYKLVFHSGDESGFIDAINMKFIQIVVPPFWYQRWWAYVLLVVFVGGIITYIFSIRVQHLHRERRLQQEFSQKQMESQEAERKRLASELHDGLGQDLLVVNNELQQYLNDPTLSREELHRVTGLMHESIESIREISSNLHPHHIERLGFCAAVEAMVEKLSHSSSKKISCICDGVDDFLPKEARIHVFRIIQESLSNIIKHSQATEARLTVRRSDQKIEITIEDNGKGFDTTHSSSTDFDQARGFGIASMVERARIIGGKLSIESALERGTRIHVVIPILGEK